MKKICIVGTGYVGLVTGSCFADMGNQVTCVDINEAKIAALNEGVIPIYEPGLEQVVQRGIKSSALTFTTSIERGAAGSDFVFICVGTPTMEGSRPNLSYVYDAYMRVCPILVKDSSTLVIKSTVPPGTANVMRSMWDRTTPGQFIPIVSNPEFLREGHAVEDFMFPDRVVIGSADPQGSESLAELYRPLKSPIFITDNSTAEFIKYASNTFLATKVSFINEMSVLCDKLGVDVTNVAKGIGMDPRIGKDYLRAGIGYGGSCLPKDIAALTYLARSHGCKPLLLDAVTQVNNRQPWHLVHHIEEALGGGFAGKTIGILGLAFKANTDDTRFSPSLEVIKALRTREIKAIKCYDPKTSEIGEGLIEMCQTPYDAATGCDAVIVATDWPEFKELDLNHLKAVMRGTVLADGRNMLDPTQVRQAGFTYIGVGRGSKDPIQAKKDVWALAS